MSAELNVVLGASGGVGRELVNALIADQRPVRAVARGALTEFDSSVATLRGDASNSEEACRLCAGASVVYFAAQPPYGQWPQLFPAMTASVIAAVSATNAKLVMVDNLYMYGPHSGPLREDAPRSATGRKGMVRIEMEKQLLDAHSSGKVNVTIGRLSDYYGPNGLNSTLSALVLEPAVKAKTMRWPGSINVPRTLHYLGDAARGLITLGDSDAANGSIWHLPAAEPISGSSFMALVNDVLRNPVSAKRIGAMSMRIGGLFSEEARESIEVMYQWTAPFVSDASAFLEEFGPIAITPHADAIRTTVEWMLRHPAEWQ